MKSYAGARKNLVEVFLEGVVHGYDGGVRPGELACELGVDVRSSSVSLQASEQYAAAASVSTCLSQARQNWWDQRSAMVMCMCGCGGVLLGFVGQARDPLSPEVDWLVSRDTVKSKIWVGVFDRG